MVLLGQYFVELSCAWLEGGHKVCSLSIEDLCIMLRTHQQNVSRAEAPIKIARMTLTIKLDRNWSSFQLANNTPPLSVTGSVIAPSARIVMHPNILSRAMGTCAWQ